MREAITQVCREDMATFYFQKFKEIFFKKLMSATFSDKKVVTPRSMTYFFTDFRTVFWKVERCGARYI